jgi:hypothetical protein
MTRACERARPKFSGAAKRLFNGQYRQRVMTSCTRDRAYITCSENDSSLMTATSGYMSATLAYPSSNPGSMRHRAEMRSRAPSEYLTAIVPKFRADMSVSCCNPSPTLRQESQKLCRRSGQKNVERQRSENKEGGNLDLDRVCRLCQCEGDGTLTERPNVLGQLKGPVLAENNHMNHGISRKLAIICH